KVSGGSDSPYITEIEGDGEFTHGERSGWMYSVNGYYPQESSNRYTVSEGDTIVWKYTKDLGEDIGGGSSTGGGLSSDTTISGSSTITEEVKKDENGKLKIEISEEKINNAVELAKRVKPEDT